MDMSLRGVFSRRDMSIHSALSFVSLAFSQVQQERETARQPVIVKRRAKWVSRERPPTTLDPGRSGGRLHDLAPDYRCSNGRH
jgi:hypothetical protein